MRLLQIVMILLLCLVVSSYLVPRSKKGGVTKSRQSRRRKHTQAMVVKKKPGFLSVGFCNDMMRRNVEPDDGVWPWWYDPCDEILKNDYVQQQKKKYLEPVRDFIMTMKDKALKVRINEMIKSMDDYYKPSKTS